MTIKEFYDSIGGNYETAQKQLMKDSLIEKFVLKFPNDTTFCSLKSAIEEKRWDDVFPVSHTLKSVCLNLAFEKLATAAATLTDSFRPQNIASRTDEETYIRFAAVESEYQKVKDAIEVYKAQLG